MSYVTFSWTWGQGRFWFTPSAMVIQTKLGSKCPPTKFLCTEGGAHDFDKGTLRRDKNCLYSLTSNSVRRCVCLVHRVGGGGVGKMVQRLRTCTALVEELEFGSLYPCQVVYKQLTAAPAQWDSVPFPGLCRHPHSCIHIPPPNTYACN